MTGNEPITLPINEVDSIKVMKAEQLLVVPVEETADLADVEQSAPDETEEPTEAQEIINALTLEDAAELIAAGTQALALSNYEDAAEKLAVAVEVQVNHLGQYAVEVASTFHLYGKALLAAAILKNTVLGEKADQVKPVENAGTAVASDNFVFEDEDVESEDEAQNLEDIEIPIGDDLELAWENLDVARLILSKQEGTEFASQLADVHISLGDVSLESESFEEAIKDYEIALKIKLDHASDNYRELAEAHFKLALAFEYSEQSENALVHIQLAMESLKKRIDFLESQSTGKGKGAVVKDDRSIEIVELNGFLSEMDSKMVDLNALLDKEDQGEEIAANPEIKEAVVAKDVNSLVKKRKVVVAEASTDSSTEKKAKIE